MASPVAHTLIGVAVAAAFSPERHEGQSKAGIATLLAAIALANLPDIDYTPGLLVGNLNAFHQGWTHSLLFACGAALLAWASLRGMKWYSGSGRRLLVCLLFAALSHLLVDMVTADLAPPRGLMLFWPLSEMRFISPASLFGEFSKPDLRSLFQVRNVAPLLREIALCAPPALLAILIRSRRSRRQPLPAGDNSGRMQSRR